VIAVHSMAEHCDSTYLSTSGQRSTLLSQSGVFGCWCVGQPPVCIRHADYVKICSLIGAIKTDGKWGLAAEYFRMLDGGARWSVDSMQAGVGSPEPMQVGRWSVRAEPARTDLMTNMRPWHSCRGAWAFNAMTS
jgi:hypothetical protein